MQRSADVTCSSALTEQGFTLIELLVVIAIIAILAAFLFPLFGTIQENARENNTMAHLHDIQLGLGLYELDNHSYPPVLFAYACNSYASTGPFADHCNINDTMQTIAGDPNATNELVGLYPEYVKSWTSFEGEDDTLNDPGGAQITSGTNGAGSFGADGTGPQPNYLCSDGTLQQATTNNNGTTTLQNSGGTCNTPPRAYYKKDAMDVGPEITGSHQLAGGAGNYTYVVRYQTSWTSWNGSYDPAKTSQADANYYGDGSPWNNYTRQLMWQNPPADTYVTAITTHVPNANKIIVLYQSGSAIKSDAQLGNPGAVPIKAFQDTTNGLITPVTETNTNNCQYTQPTSGPSPSTDTVACDYVPSQFWAINTTGR